MNLISHQTESAAEQTDEGREAVEAGTGEEKITFNPVAEEVHLGKVAKRKLSLLVEF